MLQIKPPKMNDTTKSFLIIAGGILLFGVFMLLIAGHTELLVLITTVFASIAIIAGGIIRIIYIIRTPTEDDHDPVQPLHIVEQKSSPLVCARLYIKSKGGILSFIASAMIIVTLFLLDIGDLLDKDSLVTAIRSGFITNPYNLLVIAAMLSLAGWIFHDATCNLLAAVALVGVIFVDFTGLFLIVPAILLVIAYIRMKPRFVLYTETE